MDKLTEQGTIQMHHRIPSGASPWESAFTADTAEVSFRFHQSLPGYMPTPLVSLPALARELGVRSLCIKDESKRFGLNAFKALGGSFCIASYIAEKLGVPQSELTYEDLLTPSARKILQNTTFVTATDGNHGRGIAWASRLLGARSIVLMPKGSSEERLQNIRAQGAEAEITDLNYDDAVRLANATAERIGGVMVQDTAWEGYEKYPTWIMRGYLTMGAELKGQLSLDPQLSPTHIFLQAGVGAMAGAMTGFFHSLYKDTPPVITIVEPDLADCIFRTAKADDGALHNVTGDLATIMAGLACGEPCTIGWSVLQAYAGYFASIPEYVAANGMRILASPLPGDQPVISGESGAAAFGFVTEILRRAEYAPLKEQLGLGPDSRILCISTEGDTDRDNYRRIVWDGAYQNISL